MTIKKIVQVSLLMIVIAASITLVVEQRKPSVASTSVSVFPHVVGAQLIDSTGHAFLLRGAQIESPFLFSSPWSNIEQAEDLIDAKLNSTVLQEMSQQWHMNALRLPISNWIYAKQPQLFLSLLDQVVQHANQAGLYVILALNDYAKGGSPYGQGAFMPKPESVQFWKIMASHYLTNPMVIFDAYNEPHYPDANTWLNGGGMQKGSNGKTVAIVGMQALVDAIRSVHAKQMIIIAGVKTAGTLRIHDANIIYTQHTYYKIATGNPTIWNADWSGFLGRYPLYYGEWALLPNSSVPRRCQSATPENADAKVNSFLNYVQQHSISWTAWKFDVPFLLQNTTNFTPTQLDDPQHSWKCNSPNALAGMGADVKAFLLSH